MYKHALVRALVAHFAEAAGVQGTFRAFSRPGVFEKYMAHRGGLTRTDTLHLRDGHALTVRFKRPAIFVNLVKHHNVADLVDSAAHEVVHIRWCGLPHGRLFDKRVKALLDGYHCGARGQRLPEAFR